MVYLLTNSEQDKHLERKRKKKKEKMEKRKKRKKQNFQVQEQ
jgi:hypothetical protein